MEFPIKNIIVSLKRMGHSVFENDSKPFNLNIVGIRSSNPEKNKFNDTIVVFWRYKGNWSSVSMKATTLAGLHWLKHPMNPKGSAILKEGQYKGAFRIGIHNTYKALTQSGGKVTVYRDNDKDTDWDTDDNVKTESGYFGINIHRASSKVELDEVNKFSAGCQVIQNPHEFDVFMSICNEASEVWGNNFTYTLICEEDILGIKLP